MTGGLIQLYAYGVSDVFLFGNTTKPYPYNHRDAMMHWFVNGNDGLPSKEDMVSVVDMPNILACVPISMKPSPNTLEPFRISRERACVKIQRAWRKIIREYP
jgi:hypothetical protein